MNTRVEPTSPETTASTDASGRSPRRSPGSSPRRPDSARTRRRILEAATEEFATHGFAGTRTSAIASRAHVNQQLIPYYFGGKDGLYRAVRARVRKQEEERFTAAAGTLGEQLRALVLDSADDSTVLRLMAWDALESRTPTDDPSEHIGLDHQTDLDDHVDHAHRLQPAVREITDQQAAGRLPADLEAGDLAVMLLAAATAPITHPQLIASLTTVDPSSEDHLRHYADQLQILIHHLGLVT